MSNEQIRGALSATSRRRFLVTVGTGLAAAACAGALPKPSASAAIATPSPTPTALKFASTSSSAVGFLTHVMTQRNIDTKHGLKLDVVLSDPAAAENAVLLRQVDAGLYPVISAARANNEGQPITLFGPLLWSHNYGVTYADRPYRTLADLKGKKIATLTAGSGTYQATQLVAATSGLNFEKDFQVVTLPAPGVLAILERGDVEGAIQFEPNISNLLLTGKYKVFLDHNAEWKRANGQNLLLVGLGAHQTWIDANRETATRLLAAVLETTRLIQSDPSVFRDYSIFLGLSTPEKLKEAQERMPRIYPTEWTKATADSVEGVLKKAVELKVLDKMPARPVTLVL